MTNPISQLGQPLKLETKSVGRGSDARAGTTAERTAPPAAGDRVELSDVGARARAQPDFDSARVERIRDQIASGQYSLDAARIARSFAALEGELETVRRR